jgi:hypothetical protein
MTREGSVNGNSMYEVVKQRIAEQQEAARKASLARQQRAAARGRRSRKEETETIAVPAIPDFAHEMFDAAPDAAGSRAKSGC